MMENNIWIEKFFASRNKNFILNVLHVLQFQLTIDKHHKRIQEILDVIDFQGSVSEFRSIVDESVIEIENSLDNNPQYLMRELIVNHSINVIGDTPSYWLFLALYWGYHFREKNTASIKKIYNWEIGDIVLRFVLYSLKMKKEEVKHRKGLFVDLPPRLVRIIDILIAMSRLDNAYLNRLYLPKNKDLALNFLNVQLDNPWVKDAFSVVKDVIAKKNMVWFLHQEENINLSIPTSRITKMHVLTNLDETHKDLMKLYNLESANRAIRHNKKRSRNLGNVSGQQYQLVEYISDLSEELIYEDVIVNDKQDIDEKAEAAANAEVFRRDTKPLDSESNDENESEYIIPNAFVQHKRNKGFSANLTKQQLLLPSDYDIPPTPHLKEFIRSSAEEPDANNIYFKFFILCVSLGVKAEDILQLLREEEETTLLVIENGVLSVNIDNTYFAKNIDSDMLLESDYRLSFSLAYMMRILIEDMKVEFSSIEVDDSTFLLDYKMHIENASNFIFPRTIRIKAKQVHRYFTSYIKNNGSDLITALLATGVISRNDRSIVAYTSTRTEAEGYSQTLKQFWNSLDLDSIVSSILDKEFYIPTTMETVAKNKFAGSGKVINPQKARDFFHVLRLNIYKYHEDDMEYFNYFSIYMKYAMSLLLGTREFLQSSDFNSYSAEIGIWSINEKSKNIESGIRLVPVCEIMQKLFSKYIILLERYELDHNIYLYVDSKFIGFRSEKAHQILSDMKKIVIDDKELLLDYTVNAPLNGGRHVFTKKIIPVLVRFTIIFIDLQLFYERNIKFNPQNIPPAPNFYKCWASLDLLH